MATEPGSNAHNLLSNTVEAQGDDGGGGGATPLPITSTDASLEGHSLRNRSQTTRNPERLDNPVILVCDEEENSRRERWRGQSGRSSFGRQFGKGGRLQPLRLLKQDLSNLRRRYVSDWQVFNQLVLASAVYVFFTNILPGITFASDLYVLTGRSWGTIEVVFSTGLCGIIFATLSSQPLTILGVTGPFSVLAENIYKLCNERFHIDFLPFMAWSLIHSAWMHYLLAIFNAHDWTMQYVTHFSADIFSLLNSVIYFYKAVLELQRNRAAVSFAAFLYSVIGSAGTCLLAILLSTALEWKPLLGRHIRMGLSEYAAAISIVFFIGVPHIGELATLDQQRLPVHATFRPTSPGRTVFLVPFWTLPAPWALAAVVPGAIITTLFYFDHEISSIICTLERYGVRKPGGYAWDVALLGTTTALCGILGIPPANGLLPQAPLHSESLRHWIEEECGDEGAEESEERKGQGRSPRLTELPIPGARDAATAASAAPASADATAHRKLVPRVHEQRYSHLIQSSLILAFISPPFERLLGLTPTSVLAGLFMFMGYQSLSVNPILARLGHMLTPPSELPALPPGVSGRRGSFCGGKRKERRRRGGGGWPAVHAYTATQVALTAAIFAVTLTPAAPAFPLLIIVLVPARLLIMNRIWGRETLGFVDGWACREGKPEDDVPGGDDDDDDDDDNDGGGGGDHRSDGKEKGEEGRILDEEEMVPPSSRGIFAGTAVVADGPR